MDSGDGSGEGGNDGRRKEEHGLTLIASLPTCFGLLSCNTVKWSSPSSLFESSTPSTPGSPVTWYGPTAPFVSTVRNSSHFRPTPPHCLDSRGSNTVYLQRLVQHSARARVCSKASRKLNKQLHARKMVFVLTYRGDQVEFL